VNKTPFFFSCMVAAVFLVGCPEKERRLGEPCDGYAPLEWGYKYIEEPGNDYRWTVDKSGRPRCFHPGFNAEQKKRVGMTDQPTAAWGKKGKRLWTVCLETVSGTPMSLLNSEKNHDLPYYPPCPRVPFADARKFCKDLVYAGRDDWVLPSWSQIANGWRHAKRGHYLVELKGLYNVTHAHTRNARGDVTIGGTYERSYNNNPVRGGNSSQDFRISTICMTR
jgi:hypothetical protein